MRSSCTFRSYFKPKFIPSQKKNANTPVYSTTRYKTIRTGPCFPTKKNSDGEQTLPVTNGKQTTTKPRKFTKQIASPPNYTKTTKLKTSHESSSNILQESAFPSSTHWAHAGGKDVHMHHSTKITPNVHKRLNTNLTVRSHGAYKKSQRFRNALVDAVTVAFADTWPRHVLPCISRDV